MKRLYLAAVAGLWSVAPLPAQEGPLAPTAPVVPAPVLQNGTLAPSGGVWGSGSRMSGLARWSPFRSTAEPVASAGYGYQMPPLPAGVGGEAGCSSCGAGGARTHTRGRDRSCWEKFKTWLTYHPQDTELPRHQPTPYITPLQGLFGCSTFGGAGGCSSCGAGGAPAYGPAPVYPQQSVTPSQPVPQPMPQPVPPGNAGVWMPPRGTMGAAVPPTWQGRPTAPAFAGYRYAAPNNSYPANPATGPVVNTSLK